MHLSLKGLQVFAAKSYSAKVTECYAVSVSMGSLPPDPPKRKLLDQVRDAIRLKHYSYRTEQSYVAWIRRYILFHNKRHPKDMGSLEVETFLTHLAVTEDVYKDFKDLADKIASRTELVLPNSQLTLEPELK